MSTENRLKNRGNSLQYRLLNETLLKMEDEINTIRKEKAALEARYTELTTKYKDFLVYRYNYMHIDQS